MTTESPKPISEYYPFPADQPVPQGYIYSFVKVQIKYQTGRQKIECPHCRKEGTATVSREKKAQDHRHYRSVSTSCRHCGTNVTFQWR